MHTSKLRKDLRARCRRWLGIAGVGIALSTTACVFSPRDHSLVATRTTPIEIYGYAGEPGAQIAIEAQHPNGTWAQIGATTASTSIANQGQVTPLYEYWTSVTVPLDYWSPPFEFGHGALLRVRQTTGNRMNLFTFTQGGMQCLSEALGRGEEWVQAGLDCQTGTELHLMTSED